MMEEQTKNNYKNSGFIFSGCMFIGLGIGFYLGNVAMGVLFGMGVGFLAMGIINLKKKSN
ncbi:MAG: hypothetical protein K9G76_12095 [Bacteroidales bacterium]|nr:hypothetical protein [Bacteroidales bacterium]MCF8405269.1 hypothetical protein [Bacteroidales bacterium]